MFKVARPKDPTRPSYGQVYQLPGTSAGMFMTDTVFTDSSTNAASATLSVRRGRVLRDPAAGPGLISCDGLQASFTLEQHWRSDVPPIVGMSVDAAFDTTGNLVTIRAIADGDLAKEELRRLAGQSQQKAKAAASAAYDAGAPAVRGIVARVGTPSLVAMAAVALGFLQFKAATVSLDNSGLLSISPTLYDLTKLSGSYAYMMDTLMNGGMTFMSWVCIAAVIAPILPYFLPRSRSAWLGYCAPLAFLILLPTVIISELPSNAFGRLFNWSEDFGRPISGSLSASDRMAEIAVEALREMHIDPGMGLAIAIVAALFLAGKGLFRFLAFR